MGVELSKEQSDFLETWNQQVLARSREANKTEEVKSPSKHEVTVTNADTQIGNSSIDKRKTFWVKKDDSFMLFARHMSIKWSDDPRYWKWTPVEEITHGTVEVAELLRVGLLEIKAIIDTKELSPGTSYQVSFVLMMKDYASGWENPANLGLLFANGVKKEYQKDFREIKKSEWTEIPVGKFINSRENEGKLEIFMCGTESLWWKKGMTIKSVVIRQSN